MTCEQEKQKYSEVFNFVTLILLEKYVYECYIEVCKCFFPSLLYMN